MVGGAQAAPPQLPQPRFAKGGPVGRGAGLPRAARLAGAAFLASTLGAVAGFGGAAVLLPALAAAFGVRQAIPILTVAQLVGNGSRVWFNRRELDLRVLKWFSLGAVPLALAGGFLFAAAPLGVLKRVIGAFLLCTVAWRRV